jgi:hypothetical protein
MQACFNNLWANSISANRRNFIGFHFALSPSGYFTVFTVLICSYTSVEGMPYISLQLLPLVR